MANYAINKKVQKNHYNEIEKSVEKTMSVTVIKLSYLKEAGYKYACFVFGREINRKHSNDLYKALTRAGKTKFTKRGVAMSAMAILEANKEIENKHQRILLYDLDGKELTLETADIDKYLVFLDGNHRWFVCNQHPEIDMNVELAVVSDPFEFMADYNSLSSNWSLKDWLHANQATGRTNIGVHGDVDNIEKLLGVSMKYASYLLTREREAVKKSDLEAGKDTTVNNPEFVQRGKVLANTIATIFPKPGKDATDKEKTMYKGVRTLQFLDAVEHADKVNPSKEFAKQFSAYLCGLSENDLDVISRLFEDKDTAGLKTNIAKTYGAFLKAHEHDMDIQIKQAEEMTAQTLSKGHKEDSKPESLKSGTATQLIHSIEIENAYNTVEVTKKDLDKAIEQRKKCETALKKIDEELGKASEKRKVSLTSKQDEAQKALSTAEEAEAKAKEKSEEAKAKLAELQAA